MRKIYFLLLGVMCALQLNAQLIINELSQGPSGAKEYVELLVIGTPTCGSNTVDLRGWIIDDNNGWHGAGSGTGIAQGFVRFRNVAQWANVKIGSLILIYNDADAPPALPANDVSDANADCRYIIPISNTALFERNTTTPSTSSSTYPTTGLVNGGDWDVVAMANGGDAFHTVAPTNLTAPYHAIGWGNNTNQNTVYFTGNTGGLTMAMRNLVNNDPFNAANYDALAYAGNSTPGAPNNTANATWIASLNNNCQPVATTLVRDTVARPLCQGDTININNTVRSTAGFYNDTIAAVGPACDTIRTYNVTISPLNAKTVPVALCQGQSTVINGQTVTAAGNYLDTIPSTTTSCDTIVTYTVIVIPRPTTTRAISLCPGQSVVINGQTVTTNGTYTDTVSSPTGCDTVRTNNVTVNPYNTRTVPTITLCPGQSTVINGQTVTAAGTYLDTVTSTNGGCDTILTYNVQTGNAIPVAISPNLCPGQFVVINGQQVTAAGTYTETRPASGGGCDTVITYTVTTNPYIQPTARTIHACQGQSIVINGNTYTANATIRDTVASTATCDTIFTYNLVFHAPTNSTSPVSICQGQSYFAGGALQTTSGTYVDTYTSQYGCDSVITTQLTVIQPTTQSVSQNVCIGDSYLGNVITVDTTFTVTYQSQGGCDSVIANYTLTAVAKPTVTLSDDVTIDEGQSVTLSATGGSSYAWSSGQTTPDITVTPTVTTLYIVTVSNTDGCSVVDSANVTVIPTPEIDVKIPTAFSPNGDGKNDFFDVLNRFQIQVDEFRIYNRWGELVYNNPDGEWDGKFRNMDQPIGVYVYYLKVTYLKSGKQDALQGNVTLLR